MKRIAWLASIGICLAALASPAAAQDAPLGDYARQARKHKGQQVPAVKKYDNDNLPMNDKLSVVGQEPEAAASPAPTTDGEPAPTPGDNASPASSDGNSPDKTASAEDKKPSEDKKPADEQAQKQKMFKEWQERIHQQQSQVDMLAREVDVANREYRLRAAAFYADAGNRLRNAVAWDKEDTQYKDQIVDKQKKLEEAKTKLEDLQEQARRAGVPSSMRE